MSSRHLSQASPHYSHRARHPVSPSDRLKGPWRGGPAFVDIDSRLAQNKTNDCFLPAVKLRSEGAMTIKIVIKIDPTRCEGFANCVMAAPDIFALGDDGRAKLLVSEVGVQRIEEVRRAAYNCPVSAIELKEEEGGAMSPREIPVHGMALGERVPPPSR